VEIELEDVTCRRGGKTILERLSLKIRPFERCILGGPNGSGKTTLLRLIAGLERPASGRISIGNRTVTADDELIVPPDQRGVSMLFQDLGLWPGLTVRQQISLVAQRRFPQRAEADEHVSQLLNQFQLQSLRDRRPDRLSGGEQQRTALARCLASTPSILLLDEPFAGLDPEQLRDVRQLLNDVLDRQPTTLIVVAHRFGEVADLRPTRLCFLRSGAWIKDHEAIDDWRTTEDAFVREWLAVR